MLVCQIGFAQLTTARHLEHPFFRKKERRLMTSCFLHVCVPSPHLETDGRFSQNFV
jgi:hypothetical protein